MRVGCTRIKCSDPASGHGSAPGADDRGALGLGVHMVRRPHDQHDPPFEGFRIVLSTSKATWYSAFAIPVRSSSVKVSARVCGRRPTFRAACTGPATRWGQTGRCRPAAPPWADQQQAFGLAQALQHARPGPALRARNAPPPPALRPAGPSDMALLLNPPVWPYTSRRLPHGRCEGPPGKCRTAEPWRG
jgi:hypothetical protein